MKSIPDGWHSVTPRLVVHHAQRLVEFLKSSVGPRDAMPALLYLYVDEIDATYPRALEAGAVSLEEPQDLPYGDRRAMVEDPCGNVWQIATHLG